MPMPKRGSLAARTAAGLARAGSATEHDGGFAVGVELGPIHGHIDAGAGSHRVGNRAAQCGVDVASLVGQQPVHLLDRMLGH